MIFARLSLSLHLIFFGLVCVYQLDGDNIYKIFFFVAKSDLIEEGGCGCGGVRLQNFLNLISCRKILRIVSTRWGLSSYRIIHGSVLYWTKLGRHAGFIAITT